VRFADRQDAAEHLVALMSAYRDSDAVVLGLPRGGVPVAATVAVALGLPLDILVVRKLGVPFQPELAMGAVGEDGVRVLNHVVLDNAGIEPDELLAVEERERREVDNRAVRLRGRHRRRSLEGRAAILVDDGIATGSTMRAACQVARAHGAARIVVAVPVAAPPALQMLRDEVDEVVCVSTPRTFFGVGQWYDDFRPVPDDEVISLLDRAAAADRDVTVQAGGVGLAGHLVVPPDAGGVVVFAHGSGSSRLSPRNRYVAARLGEAGLGTLLFDLLTPQEEGDRAYVFAIDLLAQRLALVLDWCRGEVDEGLQLGLFGASTGAAAALVAASRPDSPVRAVVSRGGRPDLAGERLADVRAPTLLIVGADDDVVLDLNRSAQRRMPGQTRLEVVPGATHLFEEPGALEQVADLATAWFTTHLT